MAQDAAEPMVMRIFEQAEFANQAGAIVDSPLVFTDLDVVDDNT